MSKEGVARARNVSFSPTRDYIQLHDDEPQDDVDLGTSHRSSISTSPRKSAMKPGRRARLPPPERYQHADPLLRRLRLVDGRGHPVNLKQELRDAKLVLFYFGSQWNARETKGCSGVRASAHAACRRPVPRLSA